jgi:hypothetical protein
MGYDPGEVCITQKAREELWWDDLFLTTTAHIGMGSWQGGFHTEMQR